MAASKEISFGAVFFQIVELKQTTLSLLGSGRHTTGRRPERRCAVSAGSGSAAGHPWYGSLRRQRYRRWQCGSPLRRGYSRLLRVPWAWDSAVSAAGQRLQKDHPHPGETGYRRRHAPEAGRSGHRPGLSRAAMRVSGRIVTLLRVCRASSKMGSPRNSCRRWIRVTWRHRSERKRDS